MKSRFSIKQKLSTVALVATMAAGISASVYAAEETIPSTADKELTLESLAGRYSQRITELDLEIRNETERRTDILEQLDNTMNELSELEKESDFAVQNSPKLNSNVEQINRDIEVVDRDIRLNDRLLAQVNNSLQNQPRPTVWHAALGKPEIKARHKLVATQRYLVHTIEQKQLDEMCIMYHSQNEVSRAFALFYVQDHLANHRAKANLYVRMNGIEPPTYTW